MSESALFLTGAPFDSSVVLVVSPSESSYRLVERCLANLSQVDLRWHSDTIEALADIFMSRPALLVVFGDTNAETLTFIQLVRNNHHFRDLPVFAILPEPLRLRQKMAKSVNIERFGTPLDAPQLFTKAQAILKARQNPPFKL